MDTRERKFGERPALPKRLTRNDAYDGWPSWSPDGQEIAFESKRVDENGMETPGIYVMDTEGHNVRRLTPVKSAYEPAWSPDGRKIAFVSGRDGHLDIWVMDADGKNPTNLTNDPGRDVAPGWSPDGRRIVFQSYRDGNEEIYIMDADGSGPRNLTLHPSRDQVPACSQPGFMPESMAVSAAGRRVLPWVWIKEGTLGQE